MLKRFWRRESSAARSSPWEDSGDVESEDNDEEGPTLVTVDDGKGGIKHIKVDRPADSQSEMGLLDGKSMCDVMNIGQGLPLNNVNKAKPTLGDLLKRELKGKTLFNIEPHTEKLRRRIVSKRGHVNIGKTKVSKRKRRYLSDIFNTMLDLKWRYVHLLFILSFLGSWLLFALVWYAIIYLHGDLEPDHLPDNQEKTGWVPCVWQINNFASIFLFSLETQHTIGYGGRQTTEECPEAILVMSFQSIVGVMIQACMVGIIFSKLSRPKKRSQTLMFSKNAVVCQRNGVNCLMFRIGNMRLSTLVEAHVRAILITKRVTEEGEIMPYYQTELKVGTDIDGEEDCLFFIWPSTIVHKITEDSPFYAMTARDFLKKRYELIVILEGVIEQTGNSIQVKSSYLPNEILFGYRFANLLNFKSSTSEYKIDYSLFNAVYKVDMDPRSQKVKDDDKRKEEEEIESEDGQGDKNQLGHSVSCLPGYVAAPAFRQLNDVYKSNSCVEIMHMV